jgi:hypothetical protein
MDVKLEPQPEPWLRKMLQNPSHGSEKIGSLALAHPSSKQNDYIYHNVIL